jgi:hypothetical protein
MREPPATSEAIESSLEHFKAVIKILETERKLLESAQSSREILNIYTAILKHLRQLSPEEVHKLSSQPRIKAQRDQVAPIFDLHMAELALSDVERIVESENSSRKVLEAVAIERFRVPKGSMRSFPTVQSLKEKIRTLARNERAHQTILSVTQSAKP